MAHISELAGKKSAEHQSISFHREKEHNADFIHLNGSDSNQDFIRTQTHVSSLNTQEEHNADFFHLNGNAHLNRHADFSDSNRLIWATRSGIRVNFRGHKFTIPGDVRLVEGCDPAHGDLLEFYLLGNSRAEASSLLQKLNSKYSNVNSSCFNPRLKFDVVDDRLYASMPGGAGSDFVAQLVNFQLGNYQSRVKKRFPNRPFLIHSGSAALIEFDGVPIRLCGDGAIVENQELVAKTLEAHQARRDVPRNLHVYLNFEALSYTDKKEALIKKCIYQVEHGQADVAVALCDREGDGEVILFRKVGGTTQVAKSVNPRYIDLSMVLPSFRLYLSYGVSIYFPAHHAHIIKGLEVHEYLHMLCDSILLMDREMAKEVVNGLASIDVLDDCGRLPMVCAAEKGDMEMISYLLENGASVDTKDGAGVSPLLAAKAESHNAVVDFFTREGATPEDLSFCAVIDAIDKSLFKRFHLLYKAGAEERGEDGKTALIYAAEGNKKEFLIELLKAGAAVNERGEDGKTALIYAVEGNKKEVLIELLKAGAAVNEMNKAGRTALMCAAKSGNQEICEELLSAGASIDERDTLGRTALMLACSEGHEDVVHQLLQKGASTTMRDTRGHSMSYFAEFSGNINIIDLF